MDHIIILADNLHKEKEEKLPMEEKSGIMANGHDHLKITLTSKYISSEKNKPSPSPQPVSWFVLHF